MPKSFSERERELILEKLFTKGKEYFIAHGLKKTSVADLTRAAGIAQGTFYKFFSSKEELYFTIIEKEEEGREEFLGRVFNSGEPPEKLLPLLFKEGIRYAMDNPFLAKTLERGEYELLVRKIPMERLQAHLESDREVAKKLLEDFQQQGLHLPYSPEVLTGLFRALFFMILHRDEIGADVYPEVVDLLTEALGRGLTEKERSLEKND